MPKAKSLPEKKSWAWAEGDVGREKERICERPEEGSRAVRSILADSGDETNRVVGEVVGKSNNGRVVSSVKKKRSAKSVLGYQNRFMYLHQAVYH